MIATITASKASKRLTENISYNDKINTLPLEDSTMKKSILVWDLPTRLFHWLLVGSMFFMIFSAKQGGAWMAWHLRCGLFILSLLAFRIFWGFVGSDTARFASFFKPSQIPRYLRHEISENEQAGHNPLGALMVVAMIVVIGIQIITGLFSMDVNAYVYNGYLSRFAGNYAETFRNIHANIVPLLLLMIALHVLAVLVYLFVRKNNLIHPMITGRKKLSEPLPNLRFASNIKALIAFIIFAILAYALSWI